MGCSSPTSAAFQVPPYNPPQPSGQPPAIPTNIWQTGATQNSVSVAWNPVSGATSYTYRDQLGFVNTISGTSTTLSGLSPGETIWFQVKASNSFGSSAYSGYVYLTSQQGAVTPAAPSAYDCSAQNTSDPTTEVVLCWDLVDGAVSYVVQDQYGYNANVGLRNNAHLSGLPPGTTIWAKVAGVNSAGQQGPFSNLVYMTTAQRLQLGTPNVYQCGNVTSTEVDICWNPVSGAYQYEVNNTLGADFYTAGTIAHFTGASPGESFSARVRAVDAQGNYGNWSSYIILQTLSTGIG